VIIVAGAGKLAREILTSLETGHPGEVVAWSDVSNVLHENAIVVHAGSGRALEDLIAYCRKTQSILMELATGTDIADRELEFPVVLCPNTNILMLKFMAMLARSGQLFRSDKKQIVESHQAEKTSTPGTAVDIARYLGIPPEEIQSVRNPAEQQERLRIPAEHLARHAYHRIVIEDAMSSITLETKVFGPAPYADGVARIISAIRAHRLEKRRYDILEFVENGWI